MSIIVNSFLTDEQNFPEETHAFLNSIASDDEWKEYYILGEWDSCKWEFGGTQLLKDSSLSDIIKHTIQAIKHNPEAAFESFRENTRLVWEPIHTKEYWVPDVYVENNSYGISNAPLHNMEKLQTWLINASLSFPTNIILWNTGFQLFVILIASLLLNYRPMEFKLMLVLPLLFFDIGTMLLLAGPNQRYFYCNAVLFLPILLALLPRKRANNEI